MEAPVQVGKYAGIGGASCCCGRSAVPHKRTGPRHHAAARSRMSFGPDYWTSIITVRSSAPRGIEARRGLFRPRAGCGSGAGVDTPCPLSVRMPT